MSDLWTIETVRAELDDLCKVAGIGTFRSRYTLSAAELFAMVHPHLSDANRALCAAVIGLHVQRKVIATDETCPEFAQECGHGVALWNDCDECDAENAAADLDR